MIGAILGTDEVDPQLRDLMYARSEGNPFVLEEMLKEAIEGGEMPPSGQARRSASIDEIRIPDTVRDTILLRLGRLDPAAVRILEVAAVLGPGFEYPTLLAVSDAGEAAVQSALETAVAEQLIEEQPGRPGGYRWRHALTQEAIYSDTVTPRRQEIHSRAADALAGTDSTPTVELATHLLGAGRFEEAVPVCMRAVEEAERAVAFREAAALLERLLPHLSDPLERARAVCRIGDDYWAN